MLRAGFNVIIINFANEQCVQYTGILYSSLEKRVSFGDNNRRFNLMKFIRGPITCANKKINVFNGIFRIKNAIDFNIQGVS